MNFVVNGYEWLIIFVDPDDFHLWTGNNHTLGVTDVNNKIVYIANNLDYELIQNVITHEISHVMSFSYGFDDDIYCDESMAQFVEVFADDIYSLADEIMNYL